MPQSPERKRAYNRDRQRQTRQPKTGANVISEGVPAGTGVDRGGEHYWGAVSQAPEGHRVCTLFEFGPGNWIGGCGKIVKWEGRPLSTNVNGEPDLAQAIIDSPSFKQVQGAMPLTKTRG